MGSWYRVVKTIKGRRYVYEQQTTREGKHVRTQNRYIGPEGGARSGSGSSHSWRATTTADYSWGNHWSWGSGLAFFGKEMLMQFDIKSWGNEIASQLGFVTPKKKKSYKHTVNFVTYHYNPNVTYINVSFNIVTPNTMQGDGPTSSSVRPATS